ncbi:MAG: CHAP domain-containing protein [Pseudomonadota bacterium]
MRTLLSLCVLALLSSGTAFAEQSIGPWGAASGAQQAALTSGSAVKAREALAERHLRPTVIRNQHYWCVPYARAVSGVSLRGNAWTWWRGAQGVYQRGAEPEIGSVIVMKRIRSMRLGHIGVVSEIVGPRMIRLDHANWVRGEVHRGALVKDISKNNDWSRVQVWYPPIDDFGSTTYPIYGFVYPRPAVSGS